MSFISSVSDSGVPFPSRNGYAHSLVLEDRTWLISGGTPDKLPDSRNDVFIMKPTDDVSSEHLFGIIIIY